MIENLDIKSLLDEYDIKYRTKGKNVARGDLNLEVCPFCGNSGYHCCVNIHAPIFQCWVCGAKGFILNLLKEIEVFKGQKIGKIIQPFLTEGTFGQPEGENGTLPTKNEKSTASLHLPQGILSDLPLPHRNYLTGRGFDSDFLIKKYKLMAVYNTGTQKYRFRIIVPVFINGKIVSFVAAAISRGDGIVPYLNCTPEEAIVPVNQCLYNYDSVGDTAVIVEGVTDVWRMGDGFVATFRKAMSSEQMELLLKKNPKRVIVMYDADAVEQSHALANRLCGIFPSVEVLELDKGDPADLSMAEAQEIREIIFG